MEQTTSTNDTSLLRQLSNQMADAVERVAPSIVLVNGRERQPASGVVYAPELVLTTDHVLQQEAITIETHDKRKLAAQVVGRDAASDLAVLRVAGLELAAASASAESARVGQLIMAVGRTNEEGPMASSGVVSAIGGPLRTGKGALLERYLRTDAIPYPGFSGGALIDMQGHVLGVLTTGLVQSLTLAIPMQIAITIAETLVQQGHIKRGFLGISSQLVELPAAQRPDDAQEYGLLIVKVDENSPAQQGGILLGDILVKLDGHAVRDSEDLQVVLAGGRAGKTVPIEVIRGNKLHTLSVTIGQRQ
ncbi:MAG TPA: trypsin-like peptidase domain-containing protein [Ktedonobacteraceae bacterium]|nr:trypsin-like peptidase domain-containing protein [Ktedonobacteraceae bacterium]